MHNAAICVCRLHAIHERARCVLRESAFALQSCTLPWWIGPLELKPQDTFVLYLNTPKPMSACLFGFTLTNRISAFTGIDRLIFSRSLVARLQSLLTFEVRKVEYKFLALQSNPQSSSSISLFSLLFKWVGMVSLSQDYC